MSETHSARRLEAGDAVSLKSDEVLIFGRILFTESGESKLPYGLDRPLWQIESMVSQTNNEPERKRRVIPFLRTDAEGNFAYVIPAGRYEISHVEPLGYVPYIDPALAFDADEPGVTYYLGDLEVDIDAWHWLGGLWGNYITRINRLQVIDRFDLTNSQFVARMPPAVFPKKALLWAIEGRQPEMKEQFIPPVIHR